MFICINEIRHRISKYYWLLGLVMLPESFSAELVEADERQLKPSDDQAPLVRDPTSAISTPQSSAEIPPRDGSPRVTTSTTISNIPIPLAVTGGFPAGKPFKCYCF